MSGETLTMKRGDDRTITLTLTDGNGNALDLTGASLWFYVYKADGSATVITKTVGSGITVATPASGIATVAISNANTASLLAADLNVNLPFEVQYKSAGGSIATVAEGFLYVSTDRITAT